MSQLITIPLGLPDLRIVNQCIEKDLILVEVEKDGIDRCPYCGFTSSKVHSTYQRKNIRDLSILNKPLFICLNQHRLRCSNCDEIFTQAFNSIKPKKHHTERYREYLFNLCNGTTISHVSKNENIPYTTLERIYYDIAQEKDIIKQQNLRREAAVGEEINVIGIDEIAVRKGRIYETVLTDLDHGGVLGMNHNRSHQSVINLLKHHSVLSFASIHTVVMDMWEPFHKAIREIFPSVNIIIDKYHVVQKVTQALDQVRKELQKEHPYLKNKRLLLLKSRETLNPDQAKKIQALFEQIPMLYDAYKLKESFREIYNAMDNTEAEQKLNAWLLEAKSCSFIPFKKAAKTIERWKKEILCYFMVPYTNARTEGTNHKIKNIKRRAYGYRNLERFRLRVMLECNGKERERPFIEWIEKVS